MDNDKITVSNTMGAAMSDVQRGLAWFICISFILLIFVWVFKPPVMAPESMAQLNQLVSTLQNILLLAIGFFFGSSKSSQNKDDAIMSAALAPASSVSSQTTVEGDKTTVTPAATPIVTPAVNP